MNESHIRPTRSMMGDKVRSTDGFDLGEIKELLMDSQTGRVEYAVLSFGGFMGVGNKNIAVPFESLIFHEADKCFELNVDKEVLENASTQIEYMGKSYYIY
ncbi:MAG: PRC-barrel domain-containing protein [Cytophagaceae bacterium]|nr:PRC-barrel domain-containing protein [Cytophagaceae bacterium]